MAYRNESIRVEGLEEFRDQLRAMGPKVEKEIKRVHKSAAELIAQNAKARVSGRLGPAIKPKGDLDGAKVGTEARGSYADALVRFWGTRKRTGWYAAPRYADSTRQHPEWVGNQWKPGIRDGEPYYIGDAINETVTDVEQMILEGYQAAAARAFPS